jgi:predicted nucleotidyltransferase component of viral defense system
MILPQSKDALHKAWLYRVLSAIYDEKVLADNLCFKGGTCAAMLGYLDRFSIDLDFDFIGDEQSLSDTQKHLEKIFHHLGLKIKDQSKKVPQYFLRYPAKDGMRNTLKADVTFPPPKANVYEPKEFSDIRRVIRCQTIETMFANKLVALIDRYEKNGSIAGRDLYDIHHFFLQGYQYNPGVIEERRRKSVKDALLEIRQFIERYITETVINQDLNILLAPDAFQKIRKNLKFETLMFLEDEIKRL